VLRWHLQEEQDTWLFRRCVNKLKLSWMAHLQVLLGLLVLGLIRAVPQVQAVPQAARRWEAVPWLCTEHRKDPEKIFIVLIMEILLKRLSDVRMTRKGTCLLMKMFLML
jgi:hypothetical protein